MITSDNKPSTWLEEAEHKLKQLKEVENLMDDLSWKISWALDFSKYRSIDDALEPSLTAVDNSLTEIQEQIECLEESIEAYKFDKNQADIEFEHQHEYRHNSIDSKYV